MIDNNALQSEMVNLNHEEEDTTSSSGQIGITQLIDTSITDVGNTKNSLVLKLESVISLMREVECKEKAADQAKEEAAQSSLDILVKLDHCKTALRHAQETNDMLIRKLCVNKAVLATKMEVFQLRTSHLLDDGDRLLKILDEMTRSLEMRLTSALLKKELAFKKKQENEAFALVALACEEITMEKVEEEFKSLKQEALEISKLLEFLIQHDHVLDKLHGEIFEKCPNMKQVNEELDQGFPLDGILSTLASSVSSLHSFKLEGNKNVDFEADIEKVHVIANITEDVEGETMSSEGLQSGIGCNDFPRDVEKPCGSKLCAKGIKKVKIKKNLHVAKRIKIKGLQARMEAADHIDDSSDHDINIATLKLLLIMITVICVLEIFHVSVFY